MAKILHPKKVYDGWIEVYFIRTWLRQCVDFRGSISGRDYGMSILVWGVVTLGIAGLLMGLVGLLGPEVGFSMINVCGWIWGIFSLISFTALTVRLTHSSNSFDDTELTAGHSMQAKMLPVDWWMMAFCLLFFIFGMLMMITTINSEILRPDPGVPEEKALPDSIFVTEEPIFTYQEAPVDTTVRIDSMTDLSEPDMVSPDESFDPTLKEEGETPDNPAPIDTTMYF